MHENIGKRGCRVQKLTAFVNHERLISRKNNFPKTATEGYQKTTKRRDQTVLKDRSVSSGRVNSMLSEMIEVKEATAA